MRAIRIASVAMWPQRNVGAVLRLPPGDPDAYFSPSIRGEGAGGCSSMEARWRETLIFELAGRRYRRAGLGRPGAGPDRDDHAAGARLGADRGGDQPPGVGGPGLRPPGPARAAGPGAGRFGVAGDRRLSGGGCVRLPDRPGAGPGDALHRGRRVVGAARLRRRTPRPGAWPSSPRGLAVLLDLGSLLAAVGPDREGGQP